MNSGTIRTRYDRRDGRKISATSHMVTSLHQNRHDNVFISPQATPRSERTTDEGLNDTVYVL
jgi:hypothetical protein